MWYINLKAYNSNHSRYCNSIFVRTIMFHNTITTMLELAKFLTIRERRRFESISTSWEFIPNTNPHFPRRGRVESPLVQLRYSRGSDQCRTLRDTTSLPGSLGPAYPWTHVTGSPYILTSSSVRTFAYQVPIWVELLGFMVRTTYPAN